MCDSWLGLQQGHRRDRQSWVDLVVSAMDTMADAGGIPPAPPLPVVLVAVVDTSPPSPGPWFLGIMTVVDMDTAGIGGHCRKNCES